MPHPTPGVVSIFECYRLDEFRRRMGLGDLAFREVRRRGLRVVKIGKRVYVRGKDWMDFVDRVAEGQLSNGD
jgi:hypothetical protein